jgi:hypothetical protein
MVFVPAAPLLWRLYRRLVRTEVHFFAPGTAGPGTDVLKLNNMPSPIPGVANLRRTTVAIDLSRDEDALFADMEASTRKAIRQADRCGIRVVGIDKPTEADWQDYFAAHGRLLRRKKMADPPAMGQIHELITTDRFAMSAAHTADDEILSWHTYIVSNGVARLYGTMSEMDPSKGSQWNNLVGRAHRLHHWRDMLDFKRRGLRTYDFGGIYTGNDDPEQQNIAYFKASFGGTTYDTFDAALPVSARGRFALSLQSLIKSLTHIEQPDDEPVTPAPIPERRS